MADSIREQIMKKVATQLATITTGNGYENTIASVQRFLQSGQVMRSTPYLIVHEGDEEAADDADPLTMMTLSMAIEIGTRLNEATETRSAEEVCNTLRADVRKCLMAKRGWDGLAIDTKPVDSSAIFVADGQPDLTFFMGFDIKYRHNYLNPYSLT